MPTTARIIRPLCSNGFRRSMELQNDIDAIAWDCACGSGQASRDLSKHFKRVIATDASEAQIKEAAPVPNIEYR